ncbi:hypothetical protein PE067_06030 [Paracoccus sp. DMF-8]|uniref:hypothetical protein n=1 Tax=Paracoccus sp. DMF-8 TaxID=3019445 RepID=UPI0023E7E216|nr:hypothetical protein [Paracoccus sp. DMF-8]MDF3605746.1 hypothetical protein [Paracoccus sp. DMF-8]
MIAVVEAAPVAALFLRQAHAAIQPDIAAQMFRHRTQRGEVDPFLIPVAKRTHEHVDECRCRQR